jgi:hypothetical protein
MDPEKEDEVYTPRQRYFVLKLGRVSFGEMVQINAFMVTIDAHSRVGDFRYLHLFM